MSENQTEEVKKETITDEMYINKWRSMLNTFKLIIKDSPKPADVKQKLEALSEAAKNTHHLTSAQKSGITERCANYLNGSYGRNLSHTS
jgi:hypothetical protein